MRTAFAAAIAGAALLPAIACDTHPASPVSAETHAAPAPEPPRPAATSADAEQPHAFTTTGPLVAEQQADIAAERDGRIVTIAVQVGDRVQKGQLLAAFDDRELQAQCDSDKARVESLKAQVHEWESEQKADEADLRRADYMRTQKIRSEEDWEHVKYKLDETIAEVSRYRAEEAGAEATLRDASIQREQSRIVAPFAGVVGRSSVRTAQQVKKGDVLFWITAERPLRVLFTVPETAMASFPEGTTLELTTVDYPALRQSARIERVSPVVDPASGSVQVVGRVLDPSPLLKPGMTMQVQRKP